MLATFHVGLSSELLPVVYFDYPGPLLPTSPFVYRDGASTFVG
jgi:hypothetical protein